MVPGTDECLVFYFPLGYNVEKLKERTMSENVLYNSTRGGVTGLTASRAILTGLAPDGGLFVPDHFPKFDKTIDDFRSMDYRELAYHVMKLFFTDFTEEELRACINAAYSDNFDEEEIVPLAETGRMTFLELYHGPTIAFKDMALQILPHLMTTAAKKNGVENDIVILTATSGDTGKAALAGFADVPGTGIIVFYPQGGVSYFQERQMVTQRGDNTHVVAIDGNFDDAQTGVKKLFGDKELAESLNEKGIQFSSANSINIGRLVPQIVYYVWGYTRMLNGEEIKPGETVDVCVPTGNFGNILAAFYAKQLGLPIGKMICASNTNKVLFDFFGSGEYDKNREFTLTISPSMDILVSSNLERLIYYISGNDATKTAEFMKELQTSGKYTITPEMKERLSDFRAGYATEADTLKAIHDIYEGYDYLIDTHTAVAAHVAGEYLKNNDGRRVLVASTASPYKFARSVVHAVKGDEVPLTVSKTSPEEEWKLIEEVNSLSGRDIPQAVMDVKDAPTRHSTTCAVADMKDTVISLLS